MSLSSLFAAALVSVALVAGQPENTFGDGVHVVGDEIAPGTYQAEVPPSSIGCYWARLSDLSGEVESIVTNELLEPGAMATVTIQPGDVGFESQDCGVWKPSAEVGPPIPLPRIGAGTWIVGEDVQPGTYRTVVPDVSINCYWARLGDLSGGSEPVLANDNVGGGDRVTVTVRDGDAGFTSMNCGVWELVGG